MAEGTPGAPLGRVVSFEDLVKGRRRLRLLGVLTAVLAAFALAAAFLGDGSSGWMIVAVVLAVASVGVLVASASMRRMVRSSFRVQRWMLPRDAPSADRRCARCGRPLQAIAQVTGRGGALTVWDDPGARCGRCGGPPSTVDRLRQIEAAEQLALADIDGRAGRPVGGHVKVMWDYGAWPLWPFGSSADQELAHVHLPADLTTDLHAWSDELTAVMWGPNGPDEKGFSPDPAAMDSLDQRGRSLARRVKSALGPTWRATYLSVIDDTEVEITDS